MLILVFEPQLIFHIYAVHPFHLVARLRCWGSTWDGRVQIGAEDGGIDTKILPHGQPYLTV